MSKRVSNKAGKQRKTPARSFKKNSKYKKKSKHNKSKS